MNIWLLLVLGGVITFLIRLSFIALFNHQNVPLWLQRSLRFVPPAVLSAIIAPEVLMHSGSLDLNPTNPRMLAGLAAILVAWRTKSTLLTIASGMIVLWLAQALLH